MPALYAVLHICANYIHYWRTWNYLINVVLTLVSLVYHCMWCTGMLHSLDYILVHWPLFMLAAGDVVPVTSCGLLVHSSACILCVPWEPVCLHWMWDTLYCPHTCTYTCSPVSLSCHSVDMWYMCGLNRTLLLGQVTHDRCWQCLLVLSSGPMLQ